MPRNCGIRYVITESKYGAIVINMVNLHKDHYPSYNEISNRSHNFI